MEWVHNREPVQSNSNSMILSVRLMSTACVLSILVRLPREAALDSQLLVAVSRLSRKKAQSLQAEFVTFEPVEYAEKLVGFVRVTDP